ncbi:zinc finger, CCHC-type containing protein [Tanacetum coccineum]
MFRTDRGGEFNSNEFTQYCKENGIARQLTAPYSPQQNGVVERRNRTIMSTTRSNVKATEMPQDFWAEAVRHAIYILNSVPTKALEDITPYEAIKGKKPNLKDLRVFGCISSQRNQSQHLIKITQSGGFHDAAHGGKCGSAHQPSLSFRFSCCASLIRFSETLSADHRPSDKVPVEPVSVLVEKSSAKPVPPPVSRHLGAPLAEGSRPTASAGTTTTLVVSMN